LPESPKNWWDNSVRGLAQQQERRAGEPVADTELPRAHLQQEGAAPFGAKLAGKKLVGGKPRFVAQRFLPQTLDFALFQWQQAQGPRFMTQFG
jgi:hypothetical protein